jgi:hypothetical protein
VSGMSYNGVSRSAAGWPLNLTIPSPKYGLISSSVNWNISS